ncbi:ACT domain-containing protein [Desulfobacterales bacterium HSG17]|nr:ACT domain-containing protein [Desulfobacterales bacterium HSG17]
MKEFRILFLVGKDRPGIVDEVSRILFEHTANIEDSRMATLGGCFSIMTLFSVDAEKLEGTQTGLESLQEQGFNVWFHKAQDPTAALPRDAALPLNFEVRAMDHPGIVRRVVHVLGENNVNIESLNTHVIQAPLSGAPLFDLEISAAVPKEVSIAGIKESLAELAAEENLDLLFLKAGG